MVDEPSSVTDDYDERLNTEQHEIMENNKINSEDSENVLSELAQFSPNDIRASPKHLGFKRIFRDNNMAILNPYANF